MHETDLVNRVIVRTALDLEDPNGTRPHRSVYESIIAATLAELGIAVLPDGQVALLDSATSAVLQPPEPARATGKATKKRGRR